MLSFIPQPSKVDEPSNITSISECTSVCPVLSTYISVPLGWISIRLSRAHIHTHSHIHPVADEDEWQCNNERRKLVKTYKNML